MSEPDSHRDPVEELATEFIERQRRGERPSIEEYVERYPEWASDIRDTFPTIAAMEQLKTHKEQFSDGRASLGAVKLERLGDFRIFCEIGRGGMGIVYEAEQESLGRRVALKVLPRQSLLDEKHIQRFEREAQTAASLHHTNIVPIFGVGHEDGYHFYVMQLVDGVGLDEILDGASPISGESNLPNDEERSRHIARIGLQVADALRYAHGQGTLHRDIKPANLLLDARGVVWVTDFGLAKPQGQETLSHTGQIVGTLRYMAPERFSGPADARSDIYSLGLTLYEVLTLRPAFDEADPSRLLQKIAHERPVAPRKIDPKIPADLETIVLKSIAAQPDHRYHSAGEMADDLQRFLEDRPILARRAGPVERLWRWARRNRAVAALTAAAAALLILVAAVATVGYVRTRSANIRVTNALKGQSQQRERAEATADLAVEALDSMFEQFVPDRITAGKPALADAADQQIRVPVQPVLSKEAAAMLEGMLGFYGRLAEQSGDDARLRGKVAAANRRVGDIHQRLGHVERSQIAYRRAIDLYREIGRASPDDEIIPMEIARIQNELGNLSAAEGRWDEANDFHNQALATLQAATQEPGLPPAARYEWARTHYLLASVASASENRPRPIPGPRRRNEAELRHAPRGPKHGRRKENEQQRIAALQKSHLEAAIKSLEGLVDELPGVPDYRHLLACCFRDLPAETVAQGQEPSSRPADRAVEILEKLTEEFPQVPAYQHDLSVTLSSFDFHDPTFTEKRYPVATKRLEKSLGVSERLVAAHPNVPDYAASQVQILYTLAEIERRTRRTSAAENHLRRALTLNVKLVEQFQAVASYRIWLAILQESLAKLLRNQGQLAEARALLESSLATLNELHRSEPDSPHIENLLARTYTSLADVLAQLGEEHRATEATRKARQYRKAGP